MPSLTHRFTIPAVCMYVPFALQAPLTAASSNGHAEIVAILLQADGIDVNKKVSVVIPTATLFLSSPYCPTVTDPSHRPLL